MRSELDAFINAFIQEEGIKEFMQLIEECQVLEDNDMIAVTCQCLAAIFAYEQGNNAIKKKARKYFEKFFELSAINEYVKK